jgi:hypothetical protein
MAKLVPNTQTGSLTDHQQGTDDALLGVDDASNVLYGDAFDMDDHARGGNDSLTGGDGPGLRFGRFFGAAGDMDGGRYGWR